MNSGFTIIVRRTSHLALVSNDRACMVQALMQRHDVGEPVVVRPSTTPSSPAPSSDGESPSVLGVEVGEEDDGSGLPVSPAQPRSDPLSGGLAKTLREHWLPRRSLRAL